MQAVHLFGQHSTLVLSSQYVDGQPQPGVVILSLAQAVQVAAVPVHVEQRKEHVAQAEFVASSYLPAGHVVQAVVTVLSAAQALQVVAVPEQVEH